MLPGSHLVVIGREEDALGARTAGLQLRDTLLLLLPGGRTLFAYLFRQPLEGTVVENVLKHGTGGLWIDGCRIAHVTVAGGSLDKNPHLRDSIKMGKNIAPSSYGMQRKGDLFAQADTKGRWPSNLLLVHGPECVQVGTTEYNNGKGGPSHRSPETLGKTQGGWDSLKTHRDVALCYADEHGLETIPAWSCQPDCPVRALDEQSGERKTTWIAPEHKNNRSGEFLGALSHPGNQGYNDSGGASRFFPQFASLSEALDWLTRLIGA